MRAEWDDIVGITLVTVAALVAAVLITGHFAALVFDHAWPVYRLVDVPGILSRVGADPADPGRAWDPVNSGGRPPGPVAFYGTAVFIGAGALALGIGANRYRTPGPIDREGAGWATRRQRRRLRVSRAGRRLVVGRACDVGGGLIAVEEGHSLLVFGATQSGKTTGLAVPAILDWPGPVLCTSTKGDLVDDTAGWRATRGRVHVFDPAGVTNHPGSSWTPMANSHTWDGAMADAFGLADAGKNAVGDGLRMAGLWYAGAQKLLAPYLFAAACSGRTITDVARWIDLEENDRVAALIRDHPDAAAAHHATFRKSPDARSALFQVCQQMLAVYLDPVVARSATRCDIDTADLLDGTPTTLYITAPLRDQTRFQTVFCTIIKQYIDAVYDQVAARGGRRFDPPVLLVLDECANIAPIAGLEQIVSTAAAMGLQIVTIFQDLAQLEHRYQSAAKTVINNHRGMLLLPGCKDVETLNLASRLIGDHAVDRPSVTRQDGGRQSSTTAHEWRPLLSPALARTLGNGRGVLIHGNTRPVEVKLRPWYRSRRLRTRATTPRPQQGPATPQPHPSRPTPRPPTPQAPFRA